MFLAGIQEQDGYSHEAAATLKQMQSDAYDPGTTAEFKEELGDLSPAQHKIAQMESSHTTNTLNLYFDLPMMRTMIDLKNHRAAEAVRDLEPAQKYQMRDYGVPREDLRTLSEAVAERAPAKANPRPAPPEAIKELLEEIW